MSKESLLSGVGSLMDEVKGLGIALDVVRYTLSDRLDETGRELLRYLRERRAYLLESLCRFEVDLSSELPSDEDVLTRRLDALKVEYLSVEPMMRKKVATVKAIIETFRELRGGGSCGLSQAKQVLDGWEEEEKAKGQGPSNCLNRPSTNMEAR